MDNIFQSKKKWEKKCGRPTGYNVDHLLDKKQTFFMDSLIIHIQFKTKSMNDSWDDSIQTDDHNIHVVFFFNVA